MQMFATLPPSSSIFSTLSVPILLKCIPLSIHFGEDKTKSILFGTKRKLKGLRELDIRHGDVKIKQHSQVTYLGCVLDNSLTGELMALQALTKINAKLKFLIDYFYSIKNYIDAQK